MTHPPLASDHIDAPHRRASLGDLQLESGETIAGYEQSYVTHGTLNADRSNAILVCAALTATHHRLDFLIGEGKALDSSHNFIIAVDPIGNGLSTSPSNSVAQACMKFPRFALRDMVHAQHRLLREQLGIARLRAVVGASMGGMQALQWSVSHPAFMDAVVAMTPMAKTAPWAALVTETARACLMADPTWTGDGFADVPVRGWRAYAGLMNALLMRTPAAVAELVPESGMGVNEWFEDVVAKLHANGFDAHDYLYQSRAYEAHDVGTSPGFGGDTRAALASITARSLLLAPPLDLFNPAEAAVEAAEYIRGSVFITIPSVYGHQAATSVSASAAAFLNRAIRDFLAEA